MTDKALLERIAVALERIAAAEEENLVEGKTARAQARDLMQTVTAAADRAAAYTDEFRPAPFRQCNYVMERRRCVRDEGHAGPHELHGTASKPQ